MMRTVKRLWKEEEGQDVTEYALMLTLVVLAAIAAMGTLGNAISTIFSNAAVNVT